VQRPLPEVAGEGGRLLGLLRGQRIEGFERSFKMARGALLAERALVGVPRRGAAPESLVGICRALAMPAPYLAAFSEGLAAADIVHFGYEDSPSGWLYKVYLEYAARLQGAGKGGGPVLLHRAYKWDARDPERRAVASYECFPGIETAEILARLRQLYAGQPEAPSLAAASGIATLVAARGGKAPMYLEVVEQGNPRASFDLNLHPAELRLSQVESFLRDLQRRYAIAEDVFAPLWQRVRGEKLGHVAGGRGRDGGDFFTVYHEARG
jgi:tryptophan halogenase